MESHTMAFQKRLLSSIKTQQNKEVKSMLENSYLSHSLDNFGTALLHYSAKHGNAAVISYLCDKGCDPDAQDSTGGTALMKALKRRHPEAIEALLNAGADPLKLNYENKSALQMVCSDRDLPSKPCFIFLQKFRQKCSSSEEAAQKLIDAGGHLYEAAHTKDAKVLEYMLERGFSANSTIHESKITALHVAASLTDLDSAKVLLKYGADVNAVNNKGRNPLSYVHKHRGKKQGANKVEMLRLLLSRGASPTTCCDYGHFQTMNILMEGDARTVGVVLSYWNFTAKGGFNNFDVLHYLAMNRNPGVADELKIHLHKCNVNVLNKLSSSPLHMAANSGNPRMVEFLLDHGADVNHTTYFHGHTALCGAYANRRAKFGEQRESVELLLQHGADPQQSETDDDDQRITVFDAGLMYERTGCKRLEPVIAKVALLEELGTPITETIRAEISSHPKLQLYYDRCRRMLEKEIYENVTLSKLLTCSGKNLAKYAGNKDLLQKLKRIGDKHRVRSSFSYYRNTLTKRFSRGIELRRLRDAAAGHICRIFGGRIDKTHVVVSQVSDYLSDQDLRQLCLL